MDLVSIVVVVAALGAVVVELVVVALVAFLPNRLPMRIARQNLPGKFMSCVLTVAIT